MLKKTGWNTTVKLCRFLMRIWESPHYLLLTRKKGALLIIDENVVGIGYIRERLRRKTFAFLDGVNRNES